MTPRPIDLWKHQELARDHLLDRSRRWSLVAVPTAGGKTVIIMVSVELAQWYRKVFIVAPQEHIEATFANPISFVHNGKTILVAADRWIRPRERDKKTTTDACLEAFLSSRSDRVLLTTHAQWVGWYKAGLLPKDTRDMLLVVDEGHHNGEDVTVLHSSTACWYDAGGGVWPVTATPFRDDHQPLGPPDSAIFRVGYSELVLAGIVPKRIRLEVRALEGERCLGDLSNEDIRAIAAYVKEVGRPTLIRIPIGRAREIGDRLAAELRRIGYQGDQILDMIGDGAAHVETLEAEREAARKGYEHTTVRVVLACGRGREGMDWPICSHIVNLGIPTSIVAVVQIAGRGLRGKYGIPNYPVSWADETLFTLFVPKLDDDADRTRQVEEVLTVACTLECSDAAVDYMRYWRGAVGGGRLPPVARPRQSFLESLGITSQEEETRVRIRLMAMSVGLRHALGDEGIRIDRFAACLRRDDPDAFQLFKEALLQAANGNPDLAAAIGSGLVPAFEAAVDAVVEGLSNVQVKWVFEDRLRKHFDALVVQYGHLAIRFEDRVSRGLRTILDGADISRIARSMEKARDVVFSLTDLEIASRVLVPFRKDRGAWPTLRSGEQDVSRYLGFEVSLRHIHATLERSGFDLERLVASTELGYVLSPTPDMSRVRRIPTIRDSTWASGPALLQSSTRRDMRLSNGENAVGLELAARRGWRGWPGGQTLAERMIVPGSGKTKDDAVSP
jgi:hypothetical protein